MLHSLRKLADNLREYYIVPNKLPESYFDLPEPLPPLPASFHDLKSQFLGMFPVLNSPDDIKKAINELKKSYLVKYLPSTISK
jgi:hypothetical protein